MAVNLPASLASVILQSYTNYWNIRLQAIESPGDQSIDPEHKFRGNSSDRRGWAMMGWTARAARVR